MYLTNEVYSRLLQTFNENGFSINLKSDHIVVETSEEQAGEKITKIVKSVGFCPLISKSKIDNKFAFTICPYRLPEIFNKSGAIQDIGLNSNEVSGSQIFKVSEIFFLIVTKTDYRTFGAICCVNKCLVENGNRSFQEVHELFFARIFDIHNIPKNIQRAYYLNGYRTATETLSKNIQDLSAVRDMPLGEDAGLLVKTPLTAVPLLNAWQNATDTLIVWKTLAIKINVNCPHLTKLKNIAAYVEKASSFTNWCSENCDKLGELKEPELDNKWLFSLPPEISILTGLQELSLVNNKLRALPPEIGKLTQLVELNINSNRYLRTLPVEICNLVQLKKLELLGNALTEIPAEIGKLTKLKTLYLNSNLLTRLPEQIGQLNSLKTLWLQGNKITALPVELGQLKQLKKLMLGRNPLKGHEELIAKLGDQGCKVEL